MNKRVETHESVYRCQSCGAPLTVVTMQETPLPDPSDALRAQLAAATARLTIVDRALYAWIEAEAHYTDCDLCGYDVEGERCEKGQAMMDQAESLRDAAVSEAKSDLLAAAVARVVVEIIKYKGKESRWNEMMDAVDALLAVAPWWGT